MSGPTRDDGKPGTAASGRLVSTASDPGAPRKHVSSTELLAGAREIFIDHSGETYRLRHTSQGKLILTK